MYLSQQDIFTGITAIIVIVLALAAIEVLVKAKLLHKLWGRKLLHCIAICTCTWCIHAFDNRIALAIIFLFFFFVLLWVIKKRWLQVNDYTTYGIALFPLAFSFLLFIPFLATSAIVYAGLILGICDAMAGICGTYFGKQKIIFLAETKSWAGFIAFYITALIVSLFYFDFSPQHILLCMLLALLPALTELFSYRGSDNFTVPVFTAVWMILLTHTANNNLLIILAYVCLFALLSVFAVYKKWLTISGACAACWMALLLYATGGLKAFIAPGIFLLIGSLLSKLNVPVKEKHGRNARQVFANGIVGICCLILYQLTHNNIYVTTAIISFCISMCDSTSSETGMYFKGATYDILSLRKIIPGVSGGISLAGTLGGMAGALLIAAAAGYAYQFSLKLIIYMTIGGFTGMLADGILGSLLQAKYKNALGVLTDEPDTAEALHVKGYAWCTNDMVNLISNLFITGLFFYILLQFA
jgi:uncharacterized protein (TIGR00297 family)